MATYPTILAGQRATASLLTSMQPITAVKSIDETVISTTTLQDDNELVVAVAANAVYELRMFLAYTTADTPDIKVGFSVPAGTTMSWSTRHLDPSVTSPTGIIYTGVITAADAAGLSGGGGGNMMCDVTGLVRVSTTAGNLQFRFAQLVSTASTTKVLANSWLKLTRFA